MEDAQRLLGAWVQAWGQMGGLPELFDMAAQESHPLQKVPWSAIVLQLTYTLSVARLLYRDMTDLARIPSCMHLCTRVMIELEHNDVLDID